MPRALWDNAINMADFLWKYWNFGNKKFFYAFLKAGGIYKWLYLDMNYQKFSQIELVALLHDLSLNDIGIGIESCFTITYNFLGLVTHRFYKYIIYNISQSNKLFKVFP